MVTDPSGALMPEASVELKNNAQSIVQTQSTNVVGEYSFSFVAPGNYTLGGFQLQRPRSFFPAQIQWLD